MTYLIFQSWHCSNKFSLTGLGIFPSWPLLAFDGLWWPSRTFVSPHYLIPDLVLPKVYLFIFALTKSVSPCLVLTKVGLCLVFTCLNKSMDSIFPDLIFASAVLSWIPFERTLKKAARTILSICARSLYWAYFEYVSFCCGTINQNS